MSLGSHFSLNKGEGTDLITTLAFSDSDSCDLLKMRSHLYAACHMCNCPGRSGLCCSAPGCI